NEAAVECSRRSDYVTQYTLYETGAIPGVKGLFAGCVVDVDDVTHEVLGITPLARHAAYAPAEESAVLPEQAEQAQEEQQEHVKADAVVPGTGEEQVVQPTSA